MHSLKQGWVSPRCIVSSKHGLLDGGQRGESLTEVSAQSGWTVVHSELDEGMQEISVQIGELLTWTHLLQVVRGNDQEVTEGVECVKELQHQRDLENRQAQTLLYFVNYKHQGIPCIHTRLSLSQCSGLNYKSQVSLYCDLVSKTWCKPCI